MALKEKFDKDKDQDSKVDILQIFHSFFKFLKTKQLLSFLINAVLINGMYKLMWDFFNAIVFASVIQRSTFFNNSWNIA